MKGVDTMNRIEKLRKKKGMSYSEIAEKAGVTYQYIYLLAKNKRTNPSLETMRKVAHALDEKVETVFQIN